MTSNEQLIHTFYSAFQQKDYQTMQACYADNATFSDPVFSKLSAFQARAMWEMFCVNNKGLTIEFSAVAADETIGSAEWKATYIFTPTGKKVMNHITARFTFENGKITSHTDRFSFNRWAKQALGVTGLLLGWTPFIKKKVQTMAMAALNRYISQKK